MRHCFTLIINYTTIATVGCGKAVMSNQKLTGELFDFGLVETFLVLWRIDVIRTVGGTIFHCESVVHPFAKYIHPNFIRREKKKDPAR